MEKESKPGGTKVVNKEVQNDADQQWERNRLLNEIQYLMDRGKMKEAKELKKQYRELVKKQKEKK